MRRPHGVQGLKQDVFSLFCSLLPFGSVTPRNLQTRVYAFLGLSPKHERNSARTDARLSGTASVVSHVAMVIALEINSQIDALAKINYRKKRVLEKQVLSVIAANRGLEGLCKQL